MNTRQNARRPSKTKKPAKAPAAPSAGAKPRLHFGILGSLVGFHIRMAQVAVYDDFMRGAPVAGLTPGQFAILVFIDRNPDTTQQRLADGIGAEKSTLVVRLHRLADRGLIERTRSQQDRRQNGLRLTKEGQNALDKMLEYVVQHERKLLSKLSSAERKQLIELLGRIR
jgi:DNA-binding MarR family transcriptional regulator